MYSVGRYENHAAGPLSSPIHDGPIRLRRLRSPTPR
eukprot:COSAG01_NODE_19788_length_989_cov_1.296629_1_plen_35_part_10